MLKLELDWASDEEPRDGDGVRVERVSAAGPSGHPVIAVYADGVSGAESGPKLWAWLVEEYGSSEDEASELADLAVSV